MTYSATDLGKLSGEIILEAQRNPVKIEKHGKDCVAVISIQDLETLEETKRSENLKANVQEGFAQIDRGEFSTRSMDDLFEEAKQRIDSKGES